MATLVLLAGACARSGGYQAERRGAIELTRHACGSCHLIPGVAEANGTVGPPLTHFASRQMIAGVLPNTPGDLIRYLRSPQTAVPGNAMPDQHLSRKQARDIAAYLLQLK